MQDDILATDDDTTPQIETRQIPSIVTFDLQASYSIGEHRCGWVSDTKLTVGCLNVTDKAPPRVEGAFADKYDRDLDRKSVV